MGQGGTCKGKYGGVRVGEEGEGGWTAGEQWGRGRIAALSSSDLISSSLPTASGPFIAVSSGSVTQEDGDYGVVEARRTRQGAAGGRGTCSA